MGLAEAPGVEMRPVAPYKPPRVSSMVRLSTLPASGDSSPLEMQVTCRRALRLARVINCDGFTRGGGCGEAVAAYEGTVEGGETRRRCHGKDDGFEGKG